MNPIEDLDALRSGDLARQGPALDNLNKFFDLVIQEALSALQTSDNPYPIAERIDNLGSKAVRQMEALFRATSEGNTKTLLSILLLRNGIKAGVDTLLSAFKTNSEYDFPAASALARAGIREVGPLIIERLENLDRTFYLNEKHAAYIYTLVSQLKTVDYPLPDNLEKRFTAPDAPRFLSRTIKQILDEWRK